LLAAQISDERVDTVSGKPHAVAVEETMIIGMRTDADWVVALDADMLLFPNAVASMRHELSELAGARPVVLFGIYDKLYSMKRWGLTVYSASILPELHATFQSVKQRQNLKIENAAISEMRKKGQAVVFSKTVVALHDFFQYYGDLYRKVYLNTIRNPGYTQRARQYWRKMSAIDPDYRVMAMAMQDALAGGRSLTNSFRDFSAEELQSRVSACGLTEKSELSRLDFTGMSPDTYFNELIRSNRKQSPFRDYFEVPWHVEKVRAALARLRGFLPQDAR